MSTKLKLGAGNWATKAGSLLSYNDENGNFKPLPFNFTRSTGGTRVNKDGLIEVVTNNKPRIDFLNDSNGALLLEPSRTNLITYSEALSNLSPKNGTFVDNYATSPDGTQNATKLTATDTDPYLYQSTTVSAGDYTISIYVKGIGSTIGKQFVLVLEDGVSSTLQTITSEWKRFTFSGTLSGGTAIRGVEIPNPAVTGDEVLVWGFQIEQGSYATSYIPTQGATATRAAETCIQTPPSGIIGQTEGTLFWDGVAIQGNYNQLMFIKDSSNTQFIGMTVASGVIYGEIFNSSGYVHLYSYSIGANDTRFKMALTYKTNSFAFYINGVQVANSTTGTTPTGFDDFYLNSRYNTRDFNCQINSAAIWNTHLTNAELETLTTL